MKTFLFASLTLALGSSAWAAATTVNSVNKFSHGANLGWIDWRGDTASGAVIGAFVCSGSIYSANTGWISLGDGTPVDGIRYLNNSATDFGVNHDGAGNLRGHAYGANIGWLTFTNRAADGATYNGPKVDLLTGRLSGFVWSANCGWISLSNQFAHVQTDTMDFGPDSDGDGIPDAWERQFSVSLATLNGTDDNDHDGMSDREEFEADTNPLDPLSNLRVTGTVKPTPAAPTTLTWTSSPARQYRVRASTDVTAPPPWADIGLGLIPPDAGSATSRTFASGGAQRFFLIEAVKPLSP